MIEGQELEVIPGVHASFSKTGIELDALNVWTTTSMMGLTGQFDKLQPIQHYGEWFKDQDAQYSAAGKPGLYDAVMSHSDPEAVAAFDQIVDDFNRDLDRIKVEKDRAAVETIHNRFREIRNQLPEKPKEE